MQRLGRDTGEVRLPMTPLSTTEVARLVETLKRYGLV
jgi:4-hydroxy-tetrahydrodipicolinate synthase